MIVRLFVFAVVSMLTIAEGSASQYPMVDMVPYDANGVYYRGTP